MQNPKVSLVIPAYNEEKYLGACLDHSIKNSAGDFFEIIVVDNASTDRTSEIAESYPGVRVVWEPRKGLTRARQRGFLEASGDIIAYVDADTKMPAGWYDKVINEFQNDPGLGCLSGPYIYFDLPRWQQLILKLYWYSTLPMYFILGYLVVGGNFAIRKDVLEKMRGFDTSIEFYGEDTNIARRAQKFGKVKFSLAFAINSSGRRLSQQGLPTMAGLYVFNFFSEVLTHRPFTKKYIDVR